MSDSWTSMTPLPSTRPAVLTPGPDLRPLERLLHAQRVAKDREDRPVLGPVRGLLRTDHVLKGHHHHGRAVADADALAPAAHRFERQLPPHALASRGRAAPRIVFVVVTLETG